MNVRIFWVRAMKCMCAQTRPRFILSSEGVFGGMEFEPMLTPREKFPPPENVPRGGSNPWHCGQRAQALPTVLFRPPFFFSFVRWKLQSPRWRWQYIVGPLGYHRAGGLQSFGLTSGFAYYWCSCVQYHIFFIQYHILFCCRPDIWFDDVDEILLEKPLTSQQKDGKDVLVFDNAVTQ